MKGRVVLKFRRELLNDPACNNFNSWVLLLEGITLLGDFSRPHFE